MSEEEQWGEDDAETFVGTCERCGEHRPLQWVGDPFAIERITDESSEEVHAWCRPCWELRCGDV